MEKVLTEFEMQKLKLKTACLALPETRVREEEEYVAGQPILILMSAVLSLERDCYLEARPYRQYFEHNVYQTLAPKTLEEFKNFIGNFKPEWLVLAQALWGNREQNKAKQLAELVDYFISWFQANAPGASDIDALWKWARSVEEEDFVGQVTELGPAAHQQLHWYLDGAIKFDRHVEAFVNENVGCAVPSRVAREALAGITSEMGVDKTDLDARVWDFVQGTKKKKRRGRACKRAVSVSAVSQPWMG
jgi:hypothetical protein